MNRLIYIWLAAATALLPPLAQAEEAVISGMPFPRIYSTPATADPIREAQVLALAKTIFPNRASERTSADLLKLAVDNPSIRGNLRGRLAEEVFNKNFVTDGWRPVKSKISPENDFWRRLPNGNLEGAQIKVHASTNDYFKSMRDDSKAEKFVIPDDHYEVLKKEYAIRREGALRGGDITKAEEYARQSNRLTKLGKTFDQLEGALTTSAKHYRAIAEALRQAGKAASFVAVTLGVVEGTIATIEFASGKSDVLTFATKIGKAGIGGISAWYTATIAAELAAAVGLAPVAVVIVVGTTTYLVVDWAIDKTAESLYYAKLTDSELKMIWPPNIPWVPLDTRKIN